MPAVWKFLKCRKVSKAAVYKEYSALVMQGGVKALIGALIMGSMRNLYIWHHDKLSTKLSVCKQVGKGGEKCQM